MRDVPCSVVRRRPAQARDPRGHDRRPQHRRGLRAVGRRVRRAARRRWTLNDRQKMIAERVLKEINARLRFLVDVGSRLPVARPAGRHAVRRRGAAHPARHPDRLRPGRRAVRARRAVASACTSATTTGSSRRWCGCKRAGQHADRGRARRRHHPHRRLGGRHRPGRGRARRRDRPQRLRRRAARPTRSRSPAPTWPAGGRSRRPTIRRPQTPGRELVVQGAREHNLRNLTVPFPLGQFVAVTGVSGSGKSTLVNDILYAVLANQINGARLVPGRHTRVTGLDQVDKVVGVDQSPIGRTPRSNPATYTGVFDHIRKLFAETTEAKVRGYGPGRFSFNVKGGRCENCAGDGTIKIEMNFLPDVYVPCEVCKGARYNRETLEVHYKGRTISEVLDMPIEEAASVLRGDPGDPPAPEDAGRRRPRATCGSASRRRPCPAARRSASSWRPSCRSARPAARSTCSTSRPPACTSKTSASCSRCWRAWSTRATRSSSSSTTSTSSRPPTGSSTWARRAATRAALLVAAGTPEEVAEVAGERTPASFLRHALDLDGPAKRRARRPHARATKANGTQGRPAVGEEGRRGTGGCGRRPRPRRRRPRRRRRGSGATKARG